jgi:tight adherence protein B
METHKELLDPLPLRSRHMAATTPLGRLYAATERRFGEREQWKALENLLQRAASPMLAVQFVYLSIGAAVALAVLAAIISLPVLLVVFAFAAGAVVPYAVISTLASRRLRTIDRQVPDVLNTMAALLKGGQSLRQALQNVADEGPSPISEEFARSMGDVELGLPIQTALEELARRVGSATLAFVVTATTIQLQAGGTLATLYEEIADTVIERRNFELRAKAATATGRVSGYVMMALPFFAVAELAIFGTSDYTHTLFHTGAGAAMLILSALLLTVGGLVMRSLIRFKT